MFYDTADFDPESGVFNLTSAGSFDIFVHKMSQITVSIKEDKNVNSNIVIYPNPTSGIFQITYSSTKQTKLQFTVFGSKGEIIYSESIPEFQGEYKRTVDLSNKSKGVYFAEIIADRKKSARKIVLN